MSRYIEAMTRDTAGVPSLAKDLGGLFSGLPVAAGSGMLDRTSQEPDSDLALRLRAVGGSSVFEIGGEVGGSEHGIERVDSLFEAGKLAGEAQAWANVLAREGRTWQE